MRGNSIPVDGSLTVFFGGKMTTRTVKNITTMVVIAVCFYFLARRIKEEAWGSAIVTSTLLSISFSMLERKE